MQPEHAVVVLRIEGVAEARAEHRRLRLAELSELATPLEDEHRFGRPLLVLVRLFSSQSAARAAAALCAARALAAHPLRRLELHLAVDARERVRLEHLLDGEEVLEHVLPLGRLCPCPHPAARLRHETVHDRLDPFEEELHQAHLLDLELVARRRAVLGDH